MGAVSSLFRTLEFGNTLLLPASQTYCSAPGQSASCISGDANSRNESEQFQVVLLASWPMSTHSNRYRDRDPLHPITKESTKTDIEGMQTAFRLEHNHSQFQGCGGLQTLKDLHGTPTTREHELGMVRVKATEWRLHRTPCALSTWPSIT